MLLTSNKENIRIKLIDAIEIHQRTLELVIHYFH